MAFLSLNGDFSIAQPSGLKEEIIRQVHDRMSVAGVQRRIWLADKYQATLTFSALTTAQYNYLAQYLFNGANTVTYANTVTGITFVGFPTNATDKFYEGASFLRDFTVTILQV